MFNKFSDFARRAVVLAQEASRELGHDHIGTAHLLLGVSANPECLARQALDRQGVSHDRLREVVAELSTAGDRTGATGHIPFTNQAKRTLEGALRHAKEMGHDYIGTEHVLLALLDAPPDGASEPAGAGTVLASLDVDVTALRSTLRALVDEGSSGARPTQRTTPALTEAWGKADELADGDLIGTHHMLGALAGQSASAAAQILREGGFDPAALPLPPEAWDVSGTTDDTPESRAHRSISMEVTDGAAVIRITDPAVIEALRGDSDGGASGRVAKLLASLFTGEPRPFEPPPSFTVRSGLDAREMEHELRAQGAAAGMTPEQIDKLVRAIPEILAARDDQDDG